VVQSGSKPVAVASGAPDDLPVTALDRAREDLAAGRAWKARDRLNGLLTIRQDDEVLDLLGTACAQMGDLPAAGAAWFVTGRDDRAAREALAAWRWRHGNAAAQWQSIPRPVRDASRARHVAELQRAAQTVRTGYVPRAGVERVVGVSRRGLAEALGQIIISFLLLLLLIFTVLGAITAVRWLIP
jgi:hypothetical protein